MTLLLKDLLDISELDQEIAEGYVKVQHHSSLDLSIYNYTPKTQYENHWNDITKKTRGLVVWHDVSGYLIGDQEDDVVVSRPFDKFFNWGDNTNVNCEAWEEHHEIEVTDKVDGSLGILYPHPGQPSGWAVATRGSFHSNQAEHATQWLQEWYRRQTLVNPFNPNYTYLFEIVYPQNRIVVDYGQEDSLYLIGIRDTETGFLFGLRHQQISIPRTQILRYRTFGEFLRDYRPPKGVEGCVVRSVETGEQLKFKTEEYVSLHKVIFGLNAVTVWEAMNESSEKVDELSAGLPTAELKRWVSNTHLGLCHRFFDIRIAVEQAYEGLISNFPEENLEDWVDKNSPEYRELRRVRAGFILSEYRDLSGYLFGMLDARDIRPMIMKAIRPRGDDRPTGTEEEMSG
jgi:RNA ligase